MQALYIVASSKNWHRPKFQELSEKIPGTWLFVSNIKELEEVTTRFKPKYIFFLHWSWLVPKNIWQKHECVCFHMTDVPYGRGGSPLQNLILAGHETTKLTALKMVNEMDAGPVYIKVPLSLKGSAQEIYLKAGELSAEIIEWIIEHEPVPILQEGEVVLFRRRRPDQSALPKVGSLSDAYDFIRMLDAEGYPHAFIEHGGYVLSFRGARLDNGRLVAEVEIKFKHLD